MDLIMDKSYDEINSRWMVILTGEVDIFNSDKMKNNIMEIINEKNADLYIDCRNLEYIDSTALGALVAVLKNVKLYNGEVHLLNIRSNLAKLFKITNLDKVFIIEGEQNE